MTDSGYIVAVIGAGPAGIFASKQLAADGHEVVLLNKDIKPGGLAEYGIYPTKHKMKEGLRKQFRAILSDPKVHYFGNIEVGIVGDLTFNDLREMGFSAILVTAGAQAARHLGVRGEELKGVFHAKDIVYHYNKLPPYSQKEFNIGKRVALVGGGNVMLDLARWLIDDIQVEEVISVIRRGPAEVKFDKKELESVIANLDMAGLDEELHRVTPAMLEVNENPDEARAFYLSALEKAEPHQSKSKFELRFLSSPRLLIGNEEDILKELVVEETKLQAVNGSIKAVATGVHKTLNVDTVILAIGDQVDQNIGLPLEHNQYHTNPAPVYPVDTTSYEVYDITSREVMQGVFIAGWARQASTGLVGVAKKDGTNAAIAINNYLLEQKTLPGKDVRGIMDAAHKLCLNCVDYEDIQRLEEIEQMKAQELGWEEYKFDTNEKMLVAIRSGVIA
jgi:ferredoxin--NADP+ reductase